MRRLFALIFLLTSAVTFAQTPVNGDYQYNGNVYFAKGMFIPVRDTLNPFPGRVGAQSVRPADTVGHPLTVPIYFWTGSRWMNQVSTGGGGTYTAANGLTLVGSQFRQGGPLTVNTNITGNGFSYGINTGVNNAATLAINAGVTGGLSKIGFNNPSGTFGGYVYSADYGRCSHSFLTNNIPVFSVNYAQLNFADTAGTPKMTVDATNGTFVLKQPNGNSYLEAGSNKFLTMDATDTVMYASNGRFQARALANFDPTKVLTADQFGAFSLITAPNADTTGLSFRIDQKQNFISPGVPHQYYDGIKSFLPLNVAAVTGLQDSLNAIRAAGGGGVATIYTADGTLTGDRTINTGGFGLGITNTDHTIDEAHFNFNSYTGGNSSFQVSVSDAPVTDGEAYNSSFTVNHQNILGELGYANYSGGNVVGDVTSSTATQTKDSYTNQMIRQNLGIGYISRTEYTQNPDGYKLSWSGDPNSANYIKQRQFLFDSTGFKLMGTNGSATVLTPFKIDSLGSIDVESNKGIHYTMNNTAGDNGAQVQLFDAGGATAMLQALHVTGTPSYSLSQVVLQGDTNKIISTHDLKFTTDGAIPMGTLHTDGRFTGKAATGTNDFVTLGQIGTSSIQNQFTAKQTPGAFNISATGAAKEFFAARNDSAIYVPYYSYSRDGIDTTKRIWSTGILSVPGGGPINAGGDMVWRSYSTAGAVLGDRMRLTRGGALVLPATATIGTGTLVTSGALTVLGGTGLNGSLTVTAGSNLKGSLNLSGTVTLTGTTYTVLSTDLFINCNNTATLTITLPAPNTSADGRTIYIKKISATSTVVVQSATGTIDGAATATISATNGSITLHDDGTNWFIY